MSDEENQPTSLKQQKLPVILKFTNYIEFKSALYSFAVRFGPFVVGTINDFQDFGPPIHPGAGAPIHLIQQFNKQEKDYDKYKRDCQLMCSILYHSLSTDIRIRVDGNADAYRAFGFGQLGVLWLYISDLIRETGQNSIMPMFQKIINHKTTNKQTWRQELEELIKAIKTLHSQYPTAQDKIRLWEEFETYAIVSSLRNIPDFETHFQQRVYPLRQWPSAPQIVDFISNLADSMLKLQKDASHGEVQANAASNAIQGPCFNCGGKHFRTDCTRAPTTCFKCHKQGHMAEYCDQVKSHNLNWSERKKESVQNKNTNYS